MFKLYNSRGSIQLVDTFYCCCSFLFCCELFVKKTFVLFALTFIYHTIKKTLNICPEKNPLPVVICGWWLLVDGLTLRIIHFLYQYGTSGTPETGYHLSEPTPAI